MGEVFAYLFEAYVVFLMVFAKRDHLVQHHPESSNIIVLRFLLEPHLPLLVAKIGLTSQASLCQTIREVHMFSSNVTMDKALVV